jgi:hypothetical protein
MLFELRNQLYKNAPYFYEAFEYLRTFNSYRIFFMAVISSRNSSPINSISW